MGEVRQLFQEAEPVAKPRRVRRQAAGLRPMPDRFTADEYRRLLTLAAIEGRTYEEVVYAGKSVRFWWQVHGKLRKDWVMVVVNGMRMGWAMQGFHAYRKRTQQPIAYAGSNPVYRETKLTSDAIDALVARREAAE